jgi:hypothetical protein
MKLFPHITCGFVGAHNPSWLWNRQRKQSLFRLRIHQCYWLHNWRLDSSAHTIPVDSEIITDSWVAANSKTSTKLLPQLKRGFIRARSPRWLGSRHWKLSCSLLRNHQRNYFPSWRLDSSMHTSPVDSEIVNKNWVVDDSEIVTRLPPQWTLGFISAYKPLWLGNHHKNCFPNWRFVSFVHTVVTQFLAHWLLI